MRVSAAVLGLAFGLLVAAPGSAMAQAYLGEENTLNATLGYSFSPSGQIVSTSVGDDDAFDDYNPNATIFAHIFNLSAQYMTPLRGLAVEVSMPLVGVKLQEGSFEHFPRPGPYDDYQTHWTVTDLRGGLRYQIKQIEEYIGLSFGASYSFPVKDYPTSGFAFPDQHLWAVRVGTAVARTLDPLLSNAFFQAEFEYAKRQKVDVSPETERFGRDFSDSALTIGYFLPANFRVDVAGNLRLAHGGVSFSQLVFEPPIVQDTHDRLLRESFLLVGGDVGYSVGERLDLNLGVRFFTWGLNTRNANIFGISASYQFF